MSDAEKAEKAKLAESNAKIAKLLKADEEAKAKEEEKKAKLDAKLAPLNAGKVAVEAANAAFDAEKKLEEKKAEEEKEAEAEADKKENSWKKLVIQGKPEEPAAKESKVDLAAEAPAAADNVVPVGWTKAEHWTS